MIGDGCICYDPMDGKIILLQDVWFMGQDFSTNVSFISDEHAYETKIIQTNQCTIVLEEDVNNVFNGLDARQIIGPL